MPNRVDVCGRVAQQDGLYFQCVFGLLSLTNELAQAHESAKQVTPHAALGSLPVVT